MAECTAWLQSSTDYMHAAMQAAFEALPVESISKVNGCAPQEHARNTPGTRSGIRGGAVCSSLAFTAQDGAMTIRNVCAACHDALASDERLDAYINRAAELLPSLWYAEWQCRRYKPVRAPPLSCFSNTPSLPFPSSSPPPPPPPPSSDAVAEGITRLILAGNAEALLHRIGTLCGPLIALLQQLGSEQPTSQSIDRSCAALGCVGTIIRFCGNVRAKVRFAAGRSNPSCTT